MGRRVAEALEADERLLVEAGTGTGKTLAYLVPAILSGRKVVVATGTKTLQDQIARLDLPRLRRGAGPAVQLRGDEGAGQLPVPAPLRTSTRASRTWAWTAAATSWPGWRPSSRSPPAATGPS